jgi:pimeloyl-ACP methyl ester carboxylesterase
MWPRFSPEIRRRITEEGSWTRPSAYDPAGYPITRELIEDGRQWNVMDDPLALDVPIRILQGGRDVDVPQEHALRLEQVLTGDDVVLTLVKDADHSMSRPSDLARLISAVEEVCA